MIEGHEPPAVKTGSEPVPLHSDVVWDVDPSPLEKELGEEK